MKNRKFTASLLTGLLAVSPIAVLAEDCCMPEYVPGEPLCEPCAGYSQYAGVQLDCGWDVFAWGEFLYWRPFNATVFVAEVIPPNTFTQPQIEFGHKYGWRPGFSVGLGMIAPCFDDWIFNVNYTRYHQSFSKTFSEALPNNLKSTFVFQGTTFGSIKDKFQFHYDIATGNIQRPNYLGQRVILSPFLGLKWLKRNHVYSQDLFERNGALSRAQATLKYTSLGIDAGFDGSWLLCWNLSLIGKADVAILYPYERSFRQINTPAVVTAASPVTVTHHHIRHLDMFARGGVGIGWGSYFCCNRYHLNLAATYEWMADVVKMSIYDGMFYNGSTTLMGLTIRGQFDF